MQKVENLYFIYLNFIHLFLYAVKQFLETVKQTDRESFVGPLLCRSNMIYTSSIYYRREPFSK